MNSMVQEKRNQLVKEEGTGHEEYTLSAGLLSSKKGMEYTVDVLKTRKETDGPGIFPIYSRLPDGKVVFFDRSTPLSYELQEGMQVQGIIIKNFPSFAVMAPISISKEACEIAPITADSSVSVVVNVLGHQLSWNKASRIFDELWKYFGSS